MIQLFQHFSELPRAGWRWPNFRPDEKALAGHLALACPHCGEFYLDPDAMDALQRLRQHLGRPVYVNSGHRCPIHNARVGGAPLSEHKKIAFDVAIHPHTPGQLLAAAQAAGFTTFGFYQTFLHCDRRPGRRWITSGGKRTWNGLLTF